MQWVKLPDTPGRAGGVRQSAAVAWMPGEKRFLVAAGIFPNPGRDIIAIDQPYEMQTFSLADQTWRNLLPPGREGAWGAQLGESKAPRFDGPRLDFGSKDIEGNVRLKSTWAAAESSAFDAQRGKLYVATQSVLMTFDIRTKQWDMKPLPRKPVEVAIYPGRADGGSPGTSKEPPEVVGSRWVVDPKTNTLYQIGGRCIGAPRGTIGDWALSLETMTWKPVGRAAGRFDPQAALAEKAAELAHDSESAARNALFSSGAAKAAATTAWKAAHAKLVESARNLETQLHSADVRDFAAKLIVFDALKHSTSAIGGLDTDSPADATAIKVLSDAVRAFDEAAALMGGRPIPRSNPAVTFDPGSGRIFLFGGDRGDCVLSDLWILDPKTNTWAQFYVPVSPPARTGATLAYAPERKKLILIGGTTIGDKFLIQRRDDRAMNDVWELDPSDLRWNCLGVASLPEPPETGSDRSWRVGSTVSIGEGDVAVALGYRGLKYTTDHHYDAATFFLKLGVPDDALTEKMSVRVSTRTYLSNVKQYDPTWYDSAEPGKPAEVEQFLKDLKPNVWTEMPAPQRTPPPGCWSTAAYNPELDQIYYWTGGHESDCSSLVHIYHPAINRWSIGYVPEFFTGTDTNKGITFRGRPDSNNHTYLNYAFDPASKMMVACSTGGVSVYDPAKRDWVKRSVPPFGFNLYLNKALATPRGVLFWVPSMADPRNSFFGLYDVASDKYVPLPFGGEPKRPEPQTDGTAWNYDSKRDVVWIATYDDYQKPNGQIWRYTLKTSELKVMNPEGQKTIGLCKGMSDTIRETAYVPDADVLLFNNFESDNRQVAYDPVKNAWITIPIVRPDKIDKQAIGGVGSGWVYDAGRKVIWAIGQYNHVYVLKVDPESVKR